MNFYFFVVSFVRCACFP